MTAKVIQFRSYQRSRELARMQGDLERSLAKLNEIAVEVFKSLKIDAADIASESDRSRP